MTSRSTDGRIRPWGGKVSGWLGWLAAAQISRSVRSPGGWCAKLLLATSSGSPRKRRSRSPPREQELCSIEKRLLRRSWLRIIDETRQPTESNFHLSKARLGSRERMIAAFLASPSRREEWRAATLHPTFTSFQAPYAARITKLPTSRSRLSGSIDIECLLSKETRY
ncbi:uncharacterized protein B0H64DRAFT_97633 [Chaetomium fimeti]|uniref:Uncharacterized protein n=1 Tax=Chaetomium fimeti TaxID=1854472 RepID=A0AAE0LVN4_9PEZI|nr:hypothetical protein B0H64DRAFT_97633 [Chaetomium fimeti]